MKTVNLTLDEDLWRRARVYAAKCDISASALMREALRERLERLDNPAAVDSGRVRREALVALFDEVPFELGRLPSREELHER